MDTSTYFDYTGVLRLNDSSLNLETLISYVHGDRISEEETHRARAQVLRLNGVGLVNISNDEKWEEKIVTLTTLGEIITDMIANVRSDLMVKQSVPAI